MRRFLAFICALVGAFLVLTFVACDGEIPAGLTQADLDAKAYPATHSVTGQGTSWHVRPAAGIAEWLIIAVNARVMPDGTPKGNFHLQYRSRKVGGRFFVKVSCLTIIENEAWMMGEASQAGRPHLWLGVYVADHGEGTQAVDEISHRWFGQHFEGPPEAALEFCAGTSVNGPVPRPLESGNIQVR